MKILKIQEVRGLPATVAALLEATEMEVVMEAKAPDRMSQPSPSLHGSLLLERGEWVMTVPPPPTTDTMGVGEEEFWWTERGLRSQLSTLGKAMVEEVDIQEIQAMVSY